MELTPSQKTEIEQSALDVWATNDVDGMYLQPHPSIYRHSWLWDGAFHAIGMRHYDAPRAATEVAGVFDGQWRSGMVPNVQYVRGGGLEEKLWNSRARHNATKLVGTSGITQPPVLADAVWQVGMKLPQGDRQDFWRHHVPKLSAYHEWIYRERTHGDGLFAAVHPWETGMDNKPGLMKHCQDLDWGSHVMRGLAWATQTKLIRRDLRAVDAAERSTREEGMYQAIALMSLLRARLHPERIRDEHPLHYQGIGINSVLVRNNRILAMLAHETGGNIPDELQANMQLTEENFELLWNEADQTYYSRDAITGEQIQVPSLSGTLSLYAGIPLPAERTRALVADLTNPNKYWTPHGLPNTPLDYANRRADGYWQESWMNTDYMGVVALDEHGRHGEANQLAHNILARVHSQGMHEYFNVQSGGGLGVRGFGWTAMLSLDLLHRQEN